MNGETTQCAQCGAQLSGGRFCTHCGAPVDSAPATPGGPAYDDAPTNERLHAVPDEPPRTAIPDPVTAEPVRPPPLFRDEVYPPPAPPVYADPVHPEPVPPPQRSPGVGLWIGAAVGLVVVLVLGAFLLLSGGGDDNASDASSPLIPPTHHTPSKSPSSPTSSAPTSGPTSAPTGRPTEVAGLAQASAPAHAPAAVDFAGRTVTYVAPNMVDGNVETCWRTPGDATGMVLTFRLDQPTRITKVGLVNGYAKTAVAGGRQYDWYRGDRRVLAVEWVFDDGSTVSQDFAQVKAMQTRSVPPVTTSTVQVRITSVSPPGHGPAARNDTAISEVSLIGGTS
jgi:hypothetical protein